MTELEFTILKMFVARDERLIALIDAIHIERAHSLIERFNRLQRPRRPGYTYTADGHCYPNEEVH